MTYLKIPNFVSTEPYKTKTNVLVFDIDVLLVALLSVPEFEARARRQLGQTRRQAAQTESRLVRTAAREQAATAMSTETAATTSTTAAETEGAAVAATVSAAVGDDGNGNVDEDEYEPATLDFAHSVARSAELTSLELAHQAAQNELAYASLPLLGGDSEIEEEPLQLALEETFFLMFALRCLRLETREGVRVDDSAAWSLFRRLDSRFAEKYVAYHYHRSHGW